MIIYVVDDHELMRDATVIVIGRLKREATIREFSTFEQFIAAVDDSEPPHLIVLDLKLPDTKEYEGIRRARSKCLAAKIVVYSAYPAQDRATQCFASGADVYLEKGNGLQDLKKCLSVLLI